MKARRFIQMCLMVFFLSVLIFPVTCSAAAEVGNSDKQIKADMTTAEQIMHFTEGLAGILVKGKWGFIDAAGKNVIAPIFHEVLNFKEKYAAVRLEKRWGFIDKKGRFIINPNFEGARSFSEGLAPVKRGNLWGCINEKGNLVLDYSFEDIKGFNGGLAPAKRAGKWGFIDKKGRFKISTVYLDAGEFSEKVAPVKNLENQWGYINARGKYVINAQFDEAASFSEGLALVKDDNKWGFINKKGKFVINPQYEAAHPFAEKLAAVKSQGVWGYIDTKGKTVIPFSFEGAGNFNTGLAVVSKDGMAFFIDPKGKKAIDIAAKKTMAGVTPSPPDSKLGGIECSNTTYNLCICNTLENPVFINVSEVANGDWGPRRPDHAFNSTVINSSSFYPNHCKCENLDVNQCRNTAPATFTFTVFDGMKPLYIDVWRMNNLKEISYFNSHNQGPFRLEEMRLQSKKIQVVAGSWGDNNATVILTPYGIDMTNWMAGLPDDLPLSMITAPGTHDSGTYAYPGCDGDVFVEFVKCQNKSIEEQLLLGARFLDLRLGTKAVFSPCSVYQMCLDYCYHINDLFFWHGTYFIDILFRNVLDQIKNFLATHPKEAIVIRPMTEFNCPIAGYPSTVGLFKQIITSDTYKDLFVKPPAGIPTIGSLRGKILLLNDPNIKTDPPTGVTLGYSSDVTWEKINWGDAKGQFFFVGDNYAATNKGMKRNHVTDYFSYLLSDTDRRNGLPILFVSASHAGCCPRCFADEMNRFTSKYITTSIPKSKPLGFVVMDFMGTTTQLCGSSDNYNGFAYLLVSRNFTGFINK
ncbi:MAG: WG repeat-containing protein [Syntrophobacterales bacterium]|nr:WG repeat-containing protein [Syntrophobacterales bacterium]